MTQHATTDLVVSGIKTLVIVNIVTGIIVGGTLGILFLMGII